MRPTIEKPSRTRAYGILLLGSILPFAMLLADPFAVRASSAGAMSDAACSRYLAVWGMHIGAYVGTALGIGFAFWLPRAVEGEYVARTGPADQMSFDLLVFDPISAPKDRSAFLSWYEQQTCWTEPHDYSDVAITAAPLRAWFLEIIVEFPALNGPFATDHADNDRAADYSIGHHVIYASFRWSAAAPARDAVVRLAHQHRIGFFDVSSEDGDAWVPSPEGLFEKLPRLATLDDARGCRPVPVQVDADGWTTCPSCGRRFKVTDARAFADETHLKCSQKLKLVWG